MKTMINQTKPESLRPVLEGFRRITKTEQSEYLKYLSLSIEYQRDPNERRRLRRFKAKLEKEISNAEIQTR